MIFKQFLNEIKNYICKTSTQVAELVDAPA